MSEGIIVAIIGGVFTIVGIIVSGIITSRKTEATIQSTMKVNQAVTDTKLDELTREVRAHNGFAERIPVLEYRMNEMDKEIKHLREYHEQ